MQEPLLDKTFLKDLFNSRTRETYVKITTYSRQGIIQETIEGKATGGSINIDGNSSVRRSCSLTLAIDSHESEHMHDFNWSLGTDFQLFIGLKNTTLYTQYPEIIWFPMGWYIISSYSESENLTNKSISISGKDKMCRLNGELGGVITSLTLDAGTYTDQDGVIHKVPLKDIIFNLVKTYGEESNYNIVINDLDELGKELLEYRGETPLYLFEDKNTRQVKHHTLLKEQECFLIIDGQEIQTTLADSRIIFKKITHSKNIVKEDNYSTIKLSGIDTEFNVIKLNYGEVAGYRYLDELIFAGDLIVNLGEKVTTILDKIKQMLGNYEYFYNLDGQFVFQRKQNIVTMTSPQLKRVEENGTEANPQTKLQYTTVASADLTAYTFENDELFVSKKNNYNLNNIKNDFAIWGKRNNADIFARYAIDEKPIYYRNYNYETYCADGVFPNEDNLIERIEEKNAQGQIDPGIYSIKTNQKYVSEYAKDSSFNVNSDQYHICDWRELLYQMAMDHQLYNGNKDFYSVIKNNNQNSFIFGKTGYEKYYTDISAFWRDIYDPHPQINFNRERYEDLDSIENIICTDLYTAIEKQEANNIIDKTNLYLIKEINGNPQLVKYIDQLDLYELSKNFVLENKENAEEDKKHGLYNFFYGEINKEKAIIDTLDFITNQAYIKENNKYTRLFLLLSQEDQDKVYYSPKNRQEIKKKLQDYVSIMNYSGAVDFVPYNRFYAKIDEKSEWVPINSIKILVKQDNDDKTQNDLYPLIWQYDFRNEQLSKETIALIIEAYLQHRGKLKLNLNGVGEINGNDIYDLAVKGEYESEGYILWYQETISAKPEVYNYIPLNEKFLSLAPDNKTYWPKDKHHVYFKLDENTFVETIDLINIDKSKIKVYDSQLKTYVSLFSNHIITTNDQLYLYNSEEKMWIKKDNRNLEYQIKHWPQAFSNIVFNQDGGYNEYYIKNKMNIKGTPLMYDILNKKEQFKIDPIKEKIPYYTPYFNYLLKEGKDYRDCWNKGIYEDFTVAKFWFDFIESDGKVSNYNIKNIGDRIKTEKNEKLSAIDYGAIPDIIYVPFGGIDNNIIDETQIEFSDEELKELFTISGQGISIKDQVEINLDNLLRNYIGVSLTGVPIYSLDANQQIKIIDKNNNEKYFNITRLTIPLMYNGTMSIEANILE